MQKRLGYIRLSKVGPSLEEQEEALESVGVSEGSQAGSVFIEDVSEGSAQARSVRDDLIQTLGKGDELVIMSAARLGASLSDVLDALIEVGGRGAAVYDVSLGRRVTWHPEALELATYARSAEAEHRQELVARLQTARRASGKKGGKPAKLQGEALDEAKRLWADASLSGAQVAARVGVSVRTLYRRLGDRPVE